MKDDPIVEEIHRVRRVLLDECDGDFEKLMDRFQVREKGEAEGRVVSNVEEARRPSVRT